MNLFRSRELVTLDEEEIRPAAFSTDPVEPLDVFREKTRKVIDGLTDQATMLRAEIDVKQLRLAQLERIIVAEGLALTHMED